MTRSRYHLESAAEFDRMTDALAFDLISASTHYQLYKDLRDSFEQYETQVIAAGRFWSLTLRANIQHALSCLARVYDQERTALSLRRWLEVIEANFDMLKARSFATPVHSKPFELSTGEPSRTPDRQRLRQDIHYTTNKNHFVKNLTVFRNNVVGHRSLTHAARGTDLIAEFPLRFEEVEELIGGAFDIFNLYTELFLQKYYSREVPGIDDFRLGPLNTIAGRR